ncbi:TetR/AcrR family transcriptional regulator [Nocardia heshunensis]
MDTSEAETSAESGDRRLLRGARSRLAVTERAVDIASTDGLDGLSFGRLADDLGVSKAGIQTLFRTKEKLQLATVEAARAEFLDAVVRPAQDSPAGVARLRALVDRWMDYVVAPLFPGGCFWGANLPIFDSRTGPIRDELRRQRREWVEILATQFRAALAAGEIAPIDPDLAAFQVNALLTTVNQELRLDDENSVAMARRIIDGLLTPAA